MRTSAENSIPPSFGYRAAMALAILLFTAAPFFISNYWLRILTNVMMYAVVAQGLNIIAGFTGYHAFGNSVFFGVGAYTTGVLMAIGLPFGVALLGAPIAAVLVAILVGWPVLRLSGHYFAIATVAVNMAMMELIINLGGVTGGAMGLPLPLSSMSPDSLYKVIYFLMFAVVLGVTGVVYWLDSSPLGYAFRAVRDSEIGAEVMGINTTAIKITAWAISGAFTGLAGGIWAFWFTFIEPGSAFDINVSIKGYVMMLLGGIDTVLGPLLGAFFLEMLATIVWGKFLKIHLLVLGLLIVLVVTFMPRGILNLFRLRKPARKKEEATG